MTTPVCLLLHNDSAKRDTLVPEDGAYAPQIQTQARFLYNVPSHQVS